MVLVNTLSFLTCNYVNILHQPELQ